MGLWGVLKADAKANGIPTTPVKFVIMLFFHPSLSTLLFYRTSRAMLNVPFVGIAISKVLWRLSLGAGCHISTKAQICPGLILPHPVGIVIGEGATLGSRVTIYQNVTIGRSRNKIGYPAIGDDVVVYAGAVLVGPINIGDRAVIGANAFVMESVPHETVAITPPALFHVSTPHQAAGS